MHSEGTIYETASSQLLVGISIGIHGVSHIDMRNQGLCNSSAHLSEAGTASLC